jgi:hypothetical protein
MVTAAMSSLAGENGMSGSEAGLRREARKIINGSLELLARDIRRFRRKVARHSAPSAILDGAGMVPTVPGGSYLVTDETKHVDYTTGFARSSDTLTPGYHWKFQTEGYAEFTLTVNASGQAQLRWGTLTRDASGQTRFRWDSRTYPGDPAGWRQMMTDMWSGWGKKY